MMGEDTGLACVMGQAEDTGRGVSGACVDGVDSKSSDFTE